MNNPPQVVRRPQRFSNTDQWKHAPWKPERDRIDVAVGIGLAIAAGIILGLDLAYMLEWIP